MHPVWLDANSLYLKAKLSHCIDNLDQRKRLAQECKEAWPVIAEAIRNGQIMLHCSGSLITF